MGFLLDGPLVAYRIADRRYPILSGAGAAKFGSRWNSPGVQVVYAAQNYEGALLEKLVHAGSAIPPDQVFAELLIPSGSHIWRLDESDLPSNWIENEIATRRIGDDWVSSSISVAMSVPSAVAANPLARNLLINPLHQDFVLVTASAPQPVFLDPRLFRVV